MSCTVVELEDEEEHVINWSVEMTAVLGSRLYALWNRTAGDCLLDSVLQASWGVMDRDNTLRRALADSLSEAALTYVLYHSFTQVTVINWTDGMVAILYNAVNKLSKHLTG